MTARSTRILITAFLLFFAGAATANHPAEKPNGKKKIVAKPKVNTAKSAKSPDQKSAMKPLAKPAMAPAGKSATGGNLEEVDKLCRRDLSWGKLDAVKQRCADLEPRNSPASIFWRLTLSDDPNDLRKGYAPASLAKGDVDSRLLLSAGRYHFARGQIKEMEDLVEIARKKKLAGQEIDTLKRLAAGK